MEALILLSVILAISSIVLYKKNKTLQTDLEEYEDESKGLIDENKQYEIDLATLNEKISNLQKVDQELIKTKEDLKAKEDENNTLKINTSKITQQLKELEDVKETLNNTQSTLSQKQEELSSLKQQNSKLTTSLSEQKEKYSDYKTSSDNRQEELKIELEQLKTLNSKYNEEIKSSKSLISQLETKVSQGEQNSKKILSDKESYITELKQTINTLGDDKKELQHQVNKDKATISQLQTQLEEQHKAMEEKVKLLQNSEEKLKIEFKNLASEIFESNSKKFSQQNTENLGHILNPMKAQIIDFKKKVEDVYDKEAKDRSALSQELKTLKELNEKMSKEAHNLTNALKSDSKKQGKWGEMVLEKVLESSGLREGHEFKREVNLKDDENRSFRPDVIVNLPDNRHIIIDAKTSLTAYNEYTAQEDEEQKQLYLKAHIKSVKDHIAGLAPKKYEDLKDVNSLDFIFMFVPIEGALLLALDNDVNLYDEAFKQKIILVSPTTLLVALRAVENTWRYERQAQNIADVYDRATKLYEKVDGFVTTLENVGKHIKKADSEYEKAFSQLSTGSGNVIRQATLLKQVSNIKPKKELDSVLVEGAMVDVLEDKGEEEK